MTSASWALSTPQDVLPPSPYSGLSSDTADVDIVERVCLASSSCSTWLCVLKASTVQCGISSSHSGSTSTPPHLFSLQGGSIFVLQSNCLRCLSGLVCEKDSRSLLLLALSQHFCDTPSYFQSL